MNKNFSLDSPFDDYHAPGFQTLDGLSLLLNTNTKGLLDLLYKSAKPKYSHFKIRKKNGASRSIHAPYPGLKLYQQTLAGKLQSLHTPKLSSHGFLPDRSVKTNALPHINKKFVFNIDLKDFFESIHFGRVKNLFMSRPINAPHNVATVMAHLCCHNGRLAQGAPTSPIISNMIALKLDAQLQSLAFEKKCHYTRYADDITFSFTCSKNKLPKDILAVSDNALVMPGPALTSIIESNGFIINPEKTRIRHKSQRQLVTGLIVNQFPNLSRDYIRRTSAMINALKKYGAVLAERKYIEINTLNAVPLAPRQSRRIKAKEGDFFIKVVKGRLNYIQMIRGRSDPIYRKLAYFFSIAINKENKDFLKSAVELLGESLFIVDSIIDDDGQGTAFLLEGAGIVTNFHVIDGVDNDTAPICITFTTTDVPPRVLNAELIYADKKMDLAIFYPGQVFAGIKSLSMTKLNRLRFLDPILAMGFPSHVPNAAPYINTGKIVQSREAYRSTFWLVDIPLLKGNSGGPIFNSSMEVIGIATMGSKHHDRTTIMHGFLPNDGVKSIMKMPAFIYRKKVLESKHKGCSNLPSKIDQTKPLVMVATASRPSNIWKP
jgi:RNA-directed DNA polymerase